MTTPVHTSAPWWMAIVLTGASLLGSMYAAYNHNDRELAQRLTAVEAHRTDDTQRLDRIETQLNRLLDWALGSHK